LIERQVIFGVILSALALSRALGCPSGSSLPCFTIPAQPLTDALDRFGEQSGLQVIYDDSLVAGARSNAVSGTLPVDAALSRLLANTGMVWEYVNPQTIIVRKPNYQSTNKEQSSARSHVAAVQDKLSGTPRLSVVEVWADPHRVLPNAASASSFGFAKPLLETPRSVSFISDETIDLFGLSAVEDLVRVVPGVFTTTRYGVQGAVDVRAVPADMFFRGMRRLSLQGHGRSVLAAMDTIEIVGGPPSPIYGMGKIGGYVNVAPKSGRAQSGSYLSEPEGFVQAIAGNYQRREVSFGAGGPMSMLERFDKRGGYYIYGLAEDSGSYTQYVPVKQQVIQAAVSIDDFVGPFRLEAGANYQVSRTAGALTGRFTQDLVDHGRYIRGTPLANLDLNGNGHVGYLEMHQASPVRGAQDDGNQPLMQYWDWPTDAQGRPLPIDQFPRVPGIPQSMYDYLVEHPEVDPTGALRAQGVGGPLPRSGYVPIGLVLDPRTVGYDQLDLRRAAAYEKELRAEFMTAFIDLVYDRDADFTIKNQLFFDRMDQFKHSNQPYAQLQDVFVIEDKLTITRRLHRVPPWLRVNTLASINVRNTVSRGHNISGGDFASHRTDAMAPSWPGVVTGTPPNAELISPIENSDLNSDGYPWGTIYRSEFSEFGLGLLFDIDVDSRWNFLLGGRIDRSHAKNVNYAGSFDPVAGTSENPGRYYETNVGASAWDGGVSWSGSVSYAMTRRIRPYFTISRSSIVLDGNNNALSNDIINAGHVGSAGLREVGLKASLFEDRVFATFCAFEQARLNVEVDDPEAVLYAYPSATKARGWTAELKWVPSRNLFFSAYATHQVTRYNPNYSATQLVDARTLGFQDVLDEEGNVIYPAEAFLYGGRARIILPANMPQYSKKQGNPETQVGFATTYQLHNGLGFSLAGNYFSETCTGRLCTVRIPEGVVASAGAFFETGRWLIKLDVNNLFDETLFRARTGDVLGNPLAQVMPDRRWQITVKANF
jgi:iron complex outermembrane receptor protein